MQKSYSNVPLAAGSTTQFNLPFPAAVLAGLLRGGLPAPGPMAVATCVVDPRLAAWLHEPHLVQKGETGRLERYGLSELSQHLGIATAADSKVKQCQCVV